jgi:N-acetylneuraminate synthase
VGCEDFVLLKCTSAYPATPENTNVLTIPHLRALFGCEVGLSDHTMGIGTAVAAVAHGATVIEKHFTLRRADGGVDSAFSLEPKEMKQLVVETERAWKSLGRVIYGPTEAEKDSLVFRRSLYIAEDMKKGEALTKKNLRIVRPGMGLAPKYYDILLGRKVNRDVKNGVPVNWDIINNRG